MSRPSVSELALARAWAEARIPAELELTTGERINVVYRGAWTHGFGPDFSGAMLAHPSGRLITGSIEIHLTSGGWRAHGHHTDPAYNDVVLHIVGVDDGHEVRRADGSLVPTAIVGFEQAQALESEMDWSRVGGQVCAEELSRREPGLIRSTIQRMGDERLSMKRASFEAALISRPPAELLWTAILETLGYSENRDPMRRLAQLVPLGTLERLIAGSPQRFETSAAVLLGLAGFLPLAPADAALTHLDPERLATIESLWRTLERPESTIMSPREWRVTRVRPANHPVVRLLSGAALVANQSAGLIPALLDGVREAELSPEWLIAATTRSGAALGSDRAIAMLANAILPAALALSEHAHDPDLADGAMRLWEALPASAANRVTKSAQLQVAGSSPIRQLGERGMQGLIHLHKSLCTPRRCFECPVAALVVGNGDPVG